MSRSEIIEKLKEIMIAADRGNREKFYNVTEATTLTTDLGFSSVNILYVVIVIEEVFGIRFENVTVSHFQTVGDVVDYIEGMQK